MVADCPLVGFVFFLVVFFRVGIVEASIIKEDSPCLFCVGPLRVVLTSRLAHLAHTSYPKKLCSRDPQFNRFDPILPHTSLVSGNIVMEPLLAPVSFMYRCERTYLLHDNHNNFK